MRRSGLAFAHRACAELPGLVETVFGHFVEGLKLCFGHACEIVVIAVIFARMFLAEPEHAIHATRLGSGVGAGKVAVIAVTFASFCGFLAFFLLLGRLHPYIGELDAV